MNWSVIISAAVVASIVSAIASIIVASINNQRLNKIEKEKRIFEWANYRFTKLYNILERLEALHGFTITLNDYDKTFQDAIFTRLKLVELYILTKPFLENENSKEVSTIFADEAVIYDQLCKDMTGNKSIENVPIWNDAVKKLPKALSDAISKQLSNDYIRIK